MEQVLRVRLKLRHEELLTLINQAANVKARLKDGLPLQELTEIKLKLQSALKGFEKECLRVAEHFQDDDRQDQEQYVRDEIRAEQLLAELEIIKEFNKRAVPGTMSGLNTLEPTTKLPKLQMTRFDGDIQKWPEFWAKFENSVHRQNLSKADKLAYLFSVMEGTALEALRGIDVTNDNYDVALETLKRRFGDKDLIIDAHYDALTKLEKATKSTVRFTLDAVNKHLRILTTLGEDTKGNFFRNLVCNKFPEEILYELNLLIPKEKTLDLILETLERIIQAKERSKEVLITPSSSSSTTEALHVKAVTRPPKRKLPEIKERTNIKRKRRQCVFCDGSHFDDQCREFKTPAQRRNKLGSKHLCFRCFKPGHIIRRCTNQMMCYYCKGNHNRALCNNRHEMRKEEKKPDSKLEGTPRKIQSTDFAKGKVEENVIQANVRSYLQTATALLKHKERTVPLRLLLDCGSQRSYMTEEMAKELNIIPDRYDQLIIYTFGSETPQETTSPSAEVTLVTKRGIEKQVRVNFVPHITDKVKISHLVSDNNIDVPADDNSLGERIDLLIGNDYYFSLMRNRSLEIQENLHLIDTDLGWVVSGKLSEGKDTLSQLSVVTYCQCHGSDCPYFTEPDLPLRDIDLRFLWSLESIGIVDSVKASREEEAVKYFNETVTFHNGRYDVKWPWIEYPPTLPTNFGLAFGRLKGLLRRADKATLKEYEEVLQEQLNTGVIELVEPQTMPIYQADPPIHYLPHHMVRQEGKKGRIVYDASAKLREERSLNECMYRGPSLLEDLTALLLKFRTGKIGITADVEKAFLQVGLQDSDRDVTRFLWVKNTENELTEDNLLHYRFRRVPFGIISSPFLLNATIRHHLSKTNDELLKKVADRCYVDNLVTEVNSHSEALHLYYRTKKAFDEISMNIRDWVSNDRVFLDNIPQNYRAKQCKEVKVLGLIWNLEDDSLRLRISTNNETDATERKVSKRDVLRTLSRIYDPCGFASPWILPAKMIFQEACVLKFKWDTTLPTNLQQSWVNVLDQIQTAEHIKIPRYTGNAINEAHQSYDLHCFADASKNAYAAVVYLVIKSNNHAATAFLMSKSRITPSEDKNDLKIPKLELLAFLIGSRLLKYVADNLGLSIDNKYLWTDSLIVLAWMKTSKLLPPFVSRRVNEIKQHKDVQMLYVPTQQNPADIATRPDAIQQRKELWFSGPDFLTKDKKVWPDHRVEVEKVLLSAGEALDIVDGPEMSTKGYETMEDGVTELHLPQADNDKHDELQNEIKSLQATYFPDEVSGKTTSLTRNLGLFLDNDHILRCKGRMMNTDWTYNMKHPILIPKDCEFTDKLIHELHQENYHVGVAHTLSLIRKTYWIPQGRAKVRKVLKKCPQCIKHGGGPYKLPPTPALPAERVTLSIPFTFSGMDYFGPVFVQSPSGIKEKRWICLFTCLAVRAIHLEVVRDLTAEECLMGLRRFVASRGKPNLIVSDNATQFKLISNILSSRDIRFKFIPQLAPWHGGVYERLIGTVKNCLKRTLDKHLLYDGQLLTVVKEVEAVVNTRPLTNVGADIEHILSPADFLSLGNCLELTSDHEPQLVGTITKVDLLKSWKRGQTILQEFKNMFQGQYLLSLRERYKHNLKQPRVTSDRVPNVGDMVQIKDESRNRNNWKVGKISSLIRGQDGECRVAKVRVGEQEFTRSVGHLYPLEADVEGQDVSPLKTNAGDSNKDSEGQAPDDNSPELIQIDLPNLEGQSSVEVILPDHTESELVNPPELMELDDELRTEDNVETEVDELTYSSEISDPVDGVDPGLRNRREAAIRAREKIAEWTRHLLAVL